MKFSKGLMFVALFAVSTFNVITPSSYYQAAKDRFSQAKDAYDKYSPQAKDMYGQAQEKYGQAKEAYDTYSPQARDTYNDMKTKYDNYKGKPSVNNSTDMQ